MQLKELADKLRQSGPIWRYADGFGYHVQLKDPEPGVKPMIQSDMSKVSDMHVVKALATCLSCGMSASQDEIDQAVASAHDVDSFANRIRPFIEHRSDCFAEWEQEMASLAPRKRRNKTAKKRAGRKTKKQPARKTPTKKKSVKKKATKKKVAKKKPTKKKAAKKAAKRPKRK